MFGQLIESSKKWYHDRKQKARERFLAGYYPNHERVPNCVVRCLYGIGYFFADFIPLILNLIDGIYATIKRLVGFVVGLLVDSSIFIVLIGSIIFSVSHSIDRMREVGATGGLEYVGVLMFEVIFSGSAATLTGFFMKKKKPRGALEWVGLIFTILGFGVGLGFVWWSNIGGLAPTQSGKTIGFLVPVLVLIGEVVLAYRYLSESEKDDQTKLLEFVQRNGLTIEDVLKAIKMYIAHRKSEHEHLNKEHPEQIEHKRVQPKQTDLEQTNIEHEQVEHKQAEHGQVECEQTEREQVERTEHEQTEQDEHEHAKQTGYEQPEHEQVEQIEHEQVEQAKHERVEQIEHERIEQTEHKQVEQTERKQDEHKHEQLEQVEQNEQHKIEQTDEHEQKRKQSERVQRKTKLYLVKGRGQSKVDIAIKCALKLIEQNKEFTVRELAEMAGCSLGTAQNAMNKLKEQKIAQ